MPYLEAWDEASVPLPAPVKRRAGLSFLREVLQVLVVASLLFVGTRTVVQGREVRGPSMQPTYHTGQRLFVTRYFFTDPSRGDVVVFHPPSPSRDDYIKRVIGVPGDHIQVRNGRVLVNGELLGESYLPADAQTSCAGRWCDVTLGPDEYYVMGDNRPNSSDSRAWGPVREGTIVGRAWLLYYPFSDFGFAP
jgi:signal peptidase I